MIVFDIETVEDVRGKEHDWEKFREKRKLEPWQGGGLFPEFGKVHTICAAQVFDNDQALPVGETFAESLGDHHDSDKFLLDKFGTWLDKVRVYRLCGWNIKGFDIPFIGRRMIYTRTKLPTEFLIGNKKPWEIPHLDLMEAIRFGGNDRVSLNNFLISLGIPTSKDDIDGSQVNDASIRGEHLRIQSYCKKDVSVSVKAFRELRWMGVV